MWVGMLRCVALALFASAEVSWAPFIIVDGVVCCLILTMEDFCCWDDAV